jgi:hypothetical protein
MKKTMQPTPPVSAEMPKWLEHTPAETLYVLQQEDPGGEVVQEIPLTRAEYLSLKLHLGKLRGHLAENAD